MAYRNRCLAGPGTIHIEVVYLFLFKKQTDKLISPPFGTQKRINVCQIEKHKIGKGKKLYFQASKMELETEEREREREGGKLHKRLESVPLKIASAFYLKFLLLESSLGEDSVTC